MCVAQIDLCVLFCFLPLLGVWVSSLGAIPMLHSSGEVCVSGASCNCHQRVCTIT